MRYTSYTIINVYTYLAS